MLKLIGLVYCDVSIVTWEICCYLETKLSNLSKYLFSFIGKNVVHQLSVSLEDMYNGATRKLALQKNVICDKCEGSCEAKHKLLLKLGRGVDSGST